MSWAAGMSAICLALVAIWIFAELTGRDTKRHRELRRLREMELGRMRQRAEHIERNCYFHQDVQS